MKMNSPKNHSNYTPEIETSEVNIESISEEFKIFGKIQNYFSNGL